MKILKLFLALAFIALIFGCAPNPSYKKETRVVPKIPNNSVLLEQWTDAFTNEDVSVYSWKKDGHSYLVFLMDGYDSGAMQVVEVKQ